MKDMFNLKYFHMSIMAYTDSMDCQYRMTSFDNQCEDISVENDKITITRYGMSIILLCKITGPKDLKIVNIENEVIKYVSSNTGLWTADDADDADDALSDALSDASDVD